YLSKNYEELIVKDDIGKRLHADILEGMGKPDEARNLINGPPEQTFEMMTLEAAIRAAEGDEKLQRDQQGFATIHSLLAIINGMSTLPRRKALLFFYECVDVNSMTESTFHVIIIYYIRSRTRVNSLVS